MSHESVRNAAKSMRKNLLIQIERMTSLLKEITKERIREDEVQSNLSMHHLQFLDMSHEIRPTTTV